ncbi:hypothetical protein LWI29_020655 [Acer saccharum]|uniref:Uncharacterized protein n=1 Tax=Acer saccharum TaxID=4024 RepID=A0AA39SE78_ACESA|nr:hypothetical protein LWI29_020655 [Acer saccharum]
MKKPQPRSIEWYIPDDSSHLPRFKPLHMHMLQPWYISRKFPESPFDWTAAHRRCCGGDGGLHSDRGEVQQQQGLNRDGGVVVVMLWFDVVILRWVVWGYG